MVSLVNRFGVIGIVCVPSISDFLVVKVGVVDNFNMWRTDKGFVKECLLE